MPEPADLVSVIVPAYNAERFIARCLESVLSQSHENLEVIVVDDGSQDRTSSIVEEIGRRDRRLRLIRQQNARVGAARNRAVRAARGVFVAPMDADDVWHRDKIALQLEALRDAPERLAVAYCWSLAIDEDDRVRSERPEPMAATFAGEVHGELAVHNFVGNASVPLIRRDAFDAVGGYDETLTGSEDWKLYLALAERYEFAVVQRALVGYRQTSGSMSRDLGGMVKSWNHVAHWARERRPLSRRTIRRQRFDGSTYLFLMGLRQRAYRTALRGIVVAAINDPLQFASLVLRLCGRAARRVAMRATGGPPRRIFGQS